MPVDIRLNRKFRMRRDAPAAQPIRQAPLASESASAFWWTLLLGLITLLLPGPLRFGVAGALWLIYVWFLVESPNRCIHLFIVLLPIVYMLPSGIPISGVNFETFAIPALATAAWLYSSESSGESPRNPFAAPAIYFAVLLSLSAVRSLLEGTAQFPVGPMRWAPSEAYDHFSHLKNLVFFLFLAPLAFYLIAKRRHLRVAVYMVAGAATLVAVESIWQASQRLSASSLAERRAEGFLIAEPNGLGAFLALMLSILAPLPVARGLSKRQRLIFGLATISVSIALLLTLSRGSWVGALAALFVLALTRGARMATVILLLAITSTIWLPESALERFRHTFVEDKTPLATGVELESSARVRFDQWSDMPDRFLESPLYGHGFNTYRHVWKQNHPRQRGTIFSAHSSIINLAVEEGILGLIGYGWMIWLLVMIPWRLSRSCDDPLIENVAAGLSAAAIGLVLLDSSGATFLAAESMAYVWVLGGGIARIAANDEQSAQLESTGR